jgi:hypothetical protein
MSPLLLTATIDTQGCLCEFYNDKATRAKDYFDTAKKYLEQTELDLVLIENSNLLYDYAPDWATNNPRLELITFNGNSGASQFGKGHAENKAVLTAIDHSSKLSSASMLFKVSGRYFAKGISEVIQNFNEDRHLAVFEGRNGSHFYTVFFGMDKVYYRSGMQQEVNDTNGKIMEQIVGEVAGRLPPERILWINPLQYDETIVGGSLSKFKGF